jgi:hypothetical protein
VTGAARHAWRLALLASVATCKPEAGSRCEAGEERCLDSARALVCESERFVEVPCRGTEGCRTTAAGTACDVSGNQAGDPCSRDGHGSAACADPKQLVTCRNGRFERVRCGGPRGCSVEGGRALCDTSIATADEPCDTDGKKACASDGQTVLACQAGRFSPLYACRGARGCTATSGRLDCDMTLAILGEACDPRMTGHVACAADRTGTLVCREGRFFADAPCKSGTLCRIDGTSTRCAPVPR